MTRVYKSGDYMLAAENGDLKAFKQLAPKTVSPFVYKAAVKGGNLELFKWLVTKYDGHHPVLMLTTRSLVTYGRLDMLLWLIMTNQYNTEFVALHLLTAANMEAASLGGHLDMLKWMIDTSRLPQDAVTLNIVIPAARGGHTHVLEWVLSNGYVIEPIVTLVAAANGRKSTVEWMIKKGIKLL